MTEHDKFGGAVVSASASAAAQRHGTDHVREHFQALVENSDDAIISKDMAGHIISWNPGAERLLGAVAVLMQACQAPGVHFAVDDFGIGYSALTYLRRLPAATLKIDQSFVRDMLIDEDDLTMVQSIIALAGMFQRSVIAEGVETMAIGERLLDLGCDVVQGYAIARQMPPQVVPWPANWQPFARWTGRAPPPGMPHP